MKVPFWTWLVIGYFGFTWWDAHRRAAIWRDVSKTMDETAKALNPAGLLGRYGHWR